MLVGARGPPTADEGKDKIENKRIWVGKGRERRGSRRRGRGGIGHAPSDIDWQTSPGPAP